MKKVERLEYVSRVFGAGFVLRHIVVQADPRLVLRAWQEIAACNPTSIGIRTDTNGGSTAGLNLPFLYHTTPTAEGELTAWAWCQKNVRQDHHYIVSVGIAPSESAHNVVALACDDPGDYMLEWDNGGQSQRDMEKCSADELRSLGCSTDSLVLFHGWTFRAYHPACFAMLGWDRIYPLAVAAKATEVTFTKCHDGRVVIW